MSKNATSTQYLLISFLFFISGFSGLIYQVLWTRQFKLLLGSSILSISIIVATFMAGLLIGAWWIGKRLAKKKIKNELQYYGYLEISIGLYGILLLLLLPYSKVLFSLVGAPSVEFNYIKLIINTLLTFLILAVPTTAMGATLPLLINYFSKGNHTFRKTIGHFYGINALGAAIASFVAGFFFIKNFGVNGSVFIAIILNLIIGIFAIYIAAKNNSTHHSIPEAQPATSDHTPSADNNRLSQIILATSFLTGFIAISYEVLWIRCLNYISNNSTYTFSIILFIFLLGIALGSFSLSYIKQLKNKLLTVAIFQYFLAIASLLIIYLFYAFAYTDTFSNWFMQTNNSDTPIWYHNIGLNLTLSILVFLIPSILMGMTFPLLSELYYDNKQVKSGEAISQIYVVNTFGNILGALIPIFVLIPLLGSIKWTLYLLAGVNLLIALYYILLSNTPKKNALLLMSTSIFVAVLMLTQSNNVLASLENVNEDAYSDKPIFYKEGVMATVKVYNQHNTYQSLSIDGVTIASEAFKAKESTIAHLPFFTDKPIKNVLAVGLASGSTVGSILKHPEVEQLDVVEIVPSVMDALDYFKTSNGGLQDNPKVSIYIDDIFSHLNYSDKKYDVISSDGKFGILNRSNTTMLSKDYYQVCKEHLNPKGIFIQWITTEIPNKHFKTILKTTQAVFPHSELFLIRKNLYIMSSLEPTALKHDRIVANFNDPNISQDLYDSHIFTPQEVMAYYIGPNLDSSDNTPLYNTLNTPVIEYDYNLERNKDIIKGRTSFFVNLLHLYQNYNKNKAEIIGSKNTITVNKDYINYESNQRYLSSRIAYLQAHFAMQEQQIDKMLTFFQKVVDENHPENNNNIAVAAKSIGEYHFQQKKYRKALDYFNLAIKKMDGYSDAFTMRGLCYYYLGDMTASRTNLEKALSLNPQDQTAISFLNAIQ
ncbi:fused MFS/spermidine synthase [Aureispira anguillae]|uniref:Fused MFS/spermidine synthase n=1 Tax=Aureispira anguillae TaxID=2864201 RepID=A0A915YIJ8_9BACT|nr:fused MFS/spermidine synthase [Aureispira anguillae]BDS13710.1 fused MFS/spermidine synthase [Aureispira anguillae]